MLTPAPCAFQESESRGRRYPEPAHPYRGEFERDRDRIQHARAFRRLENKTQVFTRRYSDHFRNRLTHTLEVAQISRTVARVLGLNEDLTETLALAHDLGHPPFGHAGEQALDRAMRAQGGYFDHNLHALRIVEHFEQRYLEFPGLNLSFEVREGLIKHSRDYEPAQFPELAEYDLTARPPLEAQLIDLTDELAYLCADLDDGYEAGLLPLEAILAAAPQFADLHQALRQRLPPGGEEKLCFSQALRGLLDFLVTGLIEGTRAAMAGFQSSQAVRGHTTRIAGFTPAAESERLALKRFLYRHLYHHPRLLQEKQEAEALVERAFHRLLEHPEQMPPGYRNSSSEPRFRLVCDYLAGMTDGYLRGLGL